MNYEKPEIIVKSLATDEMLMTNFCGMPSSAVTAEGSALCLRDAYAVPGGGQDNGIVRFSSGS